ncbi:transporter substrate-binding domain-containing protein [Paraburkholderia sp. 40]|uniref:transporter substrate-binding domain-containing protein n=1 Tax=Paraburkholderia sp. 40 TaxID=2991059 RepID=UPI003D258784
MPQIQTWSLRETKMKIKTLLVALCATCIPFAAFAYDGKELKFGVDSAYPPFESKTPSGELVGFDIDLGNAICAKAIDFSHKIYANFEALVVRGGSALVAMPESPNEEHIGVLQGSTQEAYARKHWTNGVDIVPYPSQDQVWNDLAGGRLDAALASGPTAESGFLMLRRVVISVSRKVRPSKTPPSSVPASASV